jgi:sugar/nucleoside kinase (ribokinase family)
VPQLDVVTFGEPMAMFMADEVGALEEATHFTRGAAGAELNVAVGLGRLGHRVGYVTRLGDDPLGRYLHAFMAGEGMETERAVFDDRHPTGFLLKNRVNSGDPQVVYYRSGSAASHLSMTDEDAGYLRSARHLHLTGIPPALSPSCRAFAYAAIDVARDSGLTISFDPNLRPSLWKDQVEMRKVVNDLAGRADWLLAGLSEGEVLTGCDEPRGVADFYLERGVRAVAVKLGAAGAFARTGDADHAVSGFDVTVVDTVGAGDGFAAGFLAGMFDGEGMAHALAQGNAVGALAVTARGDQDGLPTRDQLDRFMRQREAQ